MTLLNFYTPKVSDRRWDKRLAIAVIKQAIDDARVKIPATKRARVDRYEATNFLKSPLRLEDREFWCGILGIPVSQLEKVSLD